MKVIAVIPGSGIYILVYDHPEPEISGSLGVIYETLVFTFCGTDAAIRKFDNYGSLPPKAKYLIGMHEACGRIVDLTPGARALGFAIGDLVCPSVRRPKGISEQEPCSIEDLDRAEPGTYTERGIAEDHGFGSALVGTGASYLTKVPKVLCDPLLGSFIEPASIVAKALFEVEMRSWNRRLSFRNQRGLRIAIYGSRMIGQLLALCARLNSANTVVVYGKSPVEGNPKAELLKTIGVEYRQNPPGCDVDWRRLKPENERFDIVIEACGDGEIIPAAMTNMKRDAVFCMTGIPEATSGSRIRSIDLNEMMLASVMNHWNTCAIVNSSTHPHFDQGAKLLEEIFETFPGYLPRLQTSVIPAWDINELNRVLDEESKQLKVAMHF